jgi:hypothetical protein
MDNCRSVRSKLASGRPGRLTDIAQSEGEEEVWPSLLPFPPLAELLGRGRERLPREQGV